ncbi:MULTISPECIES: helix-turn-helix domain-containing protein [unclassified Cryobacterium]|uniref:helix-turn-helix domain-containing protein n=1 Tax=unclassified Cryobacterium TaxID=2649013 RepID=UPI00106C586A|nr:MULTISPECIES: helix-turn-helix transcriptional regulator [unclassified Cryobacterium]TFB98876.1 XRE family transcriptional regulator [Cryobacterium sp. MDB2-A-1]TFC03828.1 XRE family transcriptional regulator [Cryobacterium sp. MDB2-33-2]TFC14874.1 XRE family transcriptional regulator [Cryobacterium sp. MDB2-A-2]TFC24110.1 XRE family transcriptional regulator [Cryobacterium sp. MDB2-10]
MSAGILARSARAASGLSQSELAVRSGIAGSSLSLIENGKREPTVATLEALLLATRHTVVTLPTVRSDAARIASEIAAALAVSDEPLAFRRFLQLADNLAAERGATRVGLTLTEPLPTGSERWDTAIAALCEYRLNADALPIPDWIIARTGAPGSPWSPRTSDYDIPAEVDRVPREFRDRGILIEAATLESV